MNVYEMEGFLHGKCMPGDLLVGESTAAYLVRKLNEATAVKAERDALAVENAALKSAHPQPFGREMMKALDAYEKHQDEVPETGMLDAFFILRDSIRVETPATDTALAAIEARGVKKAATALDALSKLSASATSQANFRASAVYLRTEVMPGIGEAK